MIYVIICYQIISMTLMTPLIIVIILFFLFFCFFLDYYLYMSIFTSPEATNCFDISTLMIIRENKIIDQFPTPKHQQILLPF